MDEHSIRVLELNKVVEYLANCTVSGLGAAIARKLQPSTDKWQIIQLLLETDEARKVLDSGHKLPMDRIYDISPLLTRAELGSILEPGELLQVLCVAATSRRVKTFLQEVFDRINHLSGFAEVLKSFPHIEEAINSSIEEDGSIKDEASGALLHIRRQKRSLSMKVRERLESLVRSSEMSKYLQDALVTVRDDRYVVPVKQEFRAMVPGVIHDQSSSGATLFVEPMAVVEMNNEIRRLEIVENEEITRILARISAIVGNDANDIQICLETLGYLDFTFAKGRLSTEMGGCMPKIENTPLLQLYEARHPLLGKKAVPIDVHLGNKFSTLVITGPNTGGKTVALKTIGLLVLMAQCGLHIPAGEGSSLGIFNDVYADIGDEQSIEQSLSTFSSHMKNIVKITRESGWGCLVLLDELGAGTDPSEGAALAMAVLEYLHSKGTSTVATTHYSELKTFAFSREGIENACVEFDPVTLEPTYRLIIGLPGRSNAFEISARLGLDSLLVERAREFISEEEIKVDEMIESIETSRRTAREKLVETDLRLRAVNQLEAEYRTKLEELDEKRREILEKAKQEAASFISLAKEEVTKAVRKLREPGLTSRERAVGIEQARAAIRRASSVLDEADRDRDSQQDEIGPPLTNVQTGDSVYVTSLRENGIVLDVGDQSGSVTVGIGALKIQTNLADLRSVDQEVSRKHRTAHSLIGETYASGIAAQKAKEVSYQVDLRGMTVDEALMHLDKYLDDILLSGSNTARIIHGKGTGALRKAVREYLNNHPHIVSQRPGDIDEGGDGITVIKLR